MTDNPRPDVDLNPRAPYESLKVRTRVSGLSLTPDEATLNQIKAIEEQSNDVSAASMLFAVR